MKRLLLDVDGVIADFLKATEHGMMRYYGLKPVREWTEWDILKMDWQHWREDISRGTKNDHWGMVQSVWCQERFCLTIPEYEGAVEQVKQLAEVFDVYFVTSPMVTSRIWVYERSEWLIKKFGKNLGKKVVHTHYKELIAGSALIDDKPQHIIDWIIKNGVPDIGDRGTFAGVMDRPYNKGNDGMRRYGSLLELLSYK